MTDLLLVAIIYISFFLSLSQLVIIIIIFFFNIYIYSGNLQTGIMRNHFLKADGFWSHLSNEQLRLLKLQKRWCKIRLYVCLCVYV